MADYDWKIPPLASYLAEEMEARGWRTTDVAIRMGGDAEEIARNALALDVLLCVQKDNLLVGDRLFSELAQAFDVSEELFRNLDAAWREAPSDRREEMEPPEHLLSGVAQ
jgi:hypothetical protein